MEISIFGSPRIVRNEGPAAASFLSEVFNKDYLLVRKVKNASLSTEFLTKWVSHAAVVYLHLISEESHFALCKSLPEDKKAFDIQ